MVRLTKAEAEYGWRWVCRGLAVLGFLFLLANPKGLTVPISAYFLLTGLFFGPEVLEGQIKLVQKGKR